MADSYWRYNEARQPPPPASAIPPPTGKRPRADFDPTGSHDLPGYFPRENDRGAMRGPGPGVGVGVRDTDSINESYDRYLRSTQVPPFAGAQPPRPMGPGMPPNRPMEDPRHLGMGGPDHGANMKERPLGFGGGRPEVPLPPDASSTLFVEGLPPNCTRREVAHIFRPFVGYKEVRLVSKESRHPGGDPLVLCFVDFLSPAHAATAMDALQGYKFDEHDRDSVNLRLQFARYPGARSGGAIRGKR